MNIFFILWDDPNDPDGNVQHIAEHDLTIEDVEEVLSNPTNEGTSASTGRPCVWGYTLEGAYIIVIYEAIDPDMIRIVTAYKCLNPNSESTMSKKIERKFRERRLSAEEVARDEEIRRQVLVEFPPAAPSGSASGPLSQALKDALRGSDKSMYQIAQEAGVSQIVVSRFLSGERDIRMTTADKLAKILGLKLAFTS